MISPNQRIRPYNPPYSSRMKTPAHHTTRPTSIDTTNSSAALLPKSDASHASTKNTSSTTQALTTSQTEPQQASRDTFRRRIYASFLEKIKERHRSVKASSSASNTDKT
jgi:hypothetical protein